MGLFRFHTSGKVLVHLGGLSTVTISNLKNRKQAVWDEDAQGYLVDYELLRDKHKFLVGGLVMAHHEDKLIYADIHEKIAAWASYVVITCPICLGTYSAEIVALVGPINQKHYLASKVVDIPEMKQYPMPRVEVVVTR